MFRKKTITIFFFISRISNLIGGKTCKFYPSYPEYGSVYSVECYLDCCPIQFPKTAQSACCDRSLSWLWIVLPCFFGLSIVAIVVIGVCVYLITRKNKIQPLEATQSNAEQDIVGSRNRISKCFDPMINPIPTYQIQTHDQEVMPYLPNSTIISNRGFYIQNENIY